MLILLRMIYLIAHRLSVKRQRLNSEGSDARRHPEIIVRFISRQKRIEMFSNRMKAKDLSDFPVQGMNKFSVNESLTQRRKRLFWLAKQKAKELDYKFIWASNDLIFIRKDKKVDFVLIRTDYDQDSLLIILCTIVCCNCLLLCDAMSDTKFVDYNIANAKDNLRSTKPNAKEFTDFENTEIDLNNCLYEALIKKSKPW